MKANSWFFLALIGLMSSCHFKRSDADLVVFNAQIVTLNEQEVIQQAMAIKDGKIVAMGKDRDILNNFRYAESFDAAKQFIYPGFIDAHCHFRAYAHLLDQVDLVGCKNFDELLNRLKKYISANPHKQFIVGRGWDHTDWPGKEWPNRKRLDELFPNKVIILSRVDGHAMLVNGNALSMAGVKQNTQVPGAVFEKQNGELSGIVKENALDLFTKLIPPYSYSEEKALYLRAQKKLLSMGLTALTDAGLELEALLRLDSLYKNGELAIFLNAMASDSPQNFDFFAKKGPIQLERFSVNSFKFYLDGSLGSRSAALKDDYHDERGNKGVITLHPDSLRKKLSLVAQMHFQANTHAIGDSANSLALKIYAEILKGSNDLRWRIEHAQVLDSNDLHYFAKYNIVPSVQPTHATSDAKWAAERLGQRIKWAYAYKSLMQQLGWIPLGTDFPVEDPNPIATFASAVYRQNAKGEPIGGFQIEEALSKTDALKGICLWPALAAHQENQMGSLEEGKWANFIVLNQDLLKVGPKELQTIRVEQTWVAGKKLYTR